MKGKGKESDARTYNLKFNFQPLTLTSVEPVEKPREMTVDDLPGFSSNTPPNVRKAITLQGQEAGVDVRLYLFAWHTYGEEGFDSFVQAFKDMGSISGAIGLMGLNELSE